MSAGTVKDTYLYPQDYFKISGWEPAVKDWGSIFSETYFKPQLDAFSGELFHVPCAPKAEKKKLGLKSVAEKGLLRKRTSCVIGPFAASE